MSVKQVIKQEAKDRLSSKTIGPKCRKVRKICGIASGIALIVVSPMCPFTLGIVAVQWITFSGAILGVVAGGAHLDKSNK